MADTNLLVLAREFKKLRAYVKEVLQMSEGPQGLQGEKGEKGDKGDKGLAGNDGKDGKDGKDGLNGFNGTNGKDGLDGKDGQDGVSVTDAYIDFDGSLVFKLSNGNEINAGDISSEQAANVYATLKNGAYSLNELLPSQTGQTGKVLTTNGTNVYWNTSTGGGGSTDWASPDALGSTTPNAVYVSSGNDGAVAYFGGTGGKQILSSTLFKADFSSGNTLSLNPTTGTNNYNLNGAVGYLVNGGGTSLSAFFGTLNDGNYAGIANNVYWDPNFGFSGGYVYDKTGPASLFQATSDGISLSSAVSGTGGTQYVAGQSYLQVYNTGLYASSFASSVKSSSFFQGVGYATGAGSKVTQLTSKSTGVTLNNICGQITMSSASLAANTSVSFTLTNSTISATDVLIVNASNVAGAAPTANTYIVTVDSVLAGSCRILVRNTSSVAAAQALVLNFAVIKAVTA